MVCMEEITDNYDDDDADNATITMTYSGVLGK